MMIIDLTKCAEISTKMIEEFLATGHNFTMNQLIAESSKRFANSANLFHIGRLNTTSSVGGSTTLSVTDSTRLSVSDVYREPRIIYLCHDSCTF